MGLKSGSRDAGLDEEEADAEDDAPGEEAEEPAADEAEPGGQAEPRQSSAVSGGAPTNEAGGTSADDRPSMDSIPYKLRRSKVNEGRDQVPFFLREHVLDGEEELQESLETMLGEDVYKSDYREAAMLVAQRNPELVAEVLREWGYDLD